MKNFNWKYVLLLLAAIPVFNYVAGQFGRSAAEHFNANEPKPSQAVAPSKEIRIVVSSQDAEGVTQEQWDLNFLKNLESYTIDRVRIKAKEYLASIGQQNVAIDITSEATYVETGSIKLAVVRMQDATSRQIIIAGIVGKELKRVACIRASAEAIPVSYGPCGDKITEVFGARIGR